MRVFDGHPVDSQFGTHPRKLFCQVGNTVPKPVPSERTGDLGHQPCSEPQNMCIRHNPSCWPRRFAALYVGRRFAMKRVRAAVAAGALIVMLIFPWQNAFADAGCCTCAATVFQGVTVCNAPGCFGSVSVERCDPTNRTACQRCVYFQSDCCGGKIANHQAGEPNSCGLCQTPVGSKKKDVLPVDLPSDKIWSGRSANDGATMGRVAQSTGRK